jgi:hypothetical protein
LVDDEANLPWLQERAVVVAQAVAVGIAAETVAGMPIASAVPVVVAAERVTGIVVAQAIEVSVDAEIDVVTNAIVVYVASL